MDYDDTDFQCQNFRLVGEDNNKFPASLRTFPLQKFDLDEHRQLHLRFDSLVETEVLLGIQGEGNNWMEDFSLGDSEIEFTSSAAESCSISRHNNVWCEATSSESVEMLLKSVGENEMIEKTTIIKEADAHDGLNDMDSQMDTSLREKDSHNSKTADIIHTDPALPPESLSGLNEDAVRVHHQVEDMPRTSKDEKSKIDVDVSSLSEKLNCEREIVAKLCNMGEILISSSECATKRSSLVDESICVAVQNDNPLHNASVNSAYDDQDCIASVLAGDNFDSIPGRSNQDGPSSVSTSNLVLGSGKLNTQMLSEKVMEENSEIDICGKAGLLLDDAQMESRHIKESKVNEQPSQGPAVKSGFCSANGSYFFEPTMHSLSEGCNEPVFSENPDGLLEAITCQVKALNKENQTIDNIAPPITEGYSSQMEGDRNIEKDSVELSNNVISELSHLTEGFRNAGCGGPEHTAHDESTLLVKNTNMVDSYEASKVNSLVKVIEEKHDPEDQLTDNNNSDVRNTSRSIVKVHSSIEMSKELPTKETKDDNDLGFNPLNFDSQNPNFTVVEKYGEFEVVENIVKKSEVKLSAPQDDVLEESSSHGLLNDAEKLSSSIPSKPLDMYDTGTLITEPYDVCAIPPEVAAITKECTEPPRNSGTENSNDDASVEEKMEDASSELMDCSSVKKLIHDESVDVNLHSVHNSTIVHLYQSGDTHAVDVVVEQKEVTTPPLPASDFIRPDVKEVENGSTILKSNLDDVSKESVKVSDPVVLDGSLAKDIIQDDPGVKLVSVKNLTSFQQSEFEDSMVMDAVVVQKEERMSGLPVTDLIHSDEKEMKTSGVANLSVSKCIVGSQISSGPTTHSDSSKDSPLASLTEVQPIVVGQFSSSMEGSFCVGSQNEFHSSIDSPVTHVSAIKGKGDSDSLGVFSEEERTLVASAKRSSHDDRLAMHIPPSSKIYDCQHKQQSTEANLSPGDNCHRQNGTRQTEGDTLNCCTNSSSESLSMTRSNADSYMVEAEAANPSSFEQNCGSPTVISCSEHQDEIYRQGNKGLPDRMDPASGSLQYVSSGTRGDDDKVTPSAHDSKENTTSEDDRSFTFEVGLLGDISERDNGNKWKPFSSMQSFDLHQMSKENSEGHFPESEKGKLPGTITKTPDEDKTRQASCCSTERLTTSQGKTAKETPILKQTSVSDGNSYSASPKSFGTSSRNMLLEEIRHYPYIESSIKASCSPAVQMSGLPDLNTSVSTAALFHQPFTDLQQIQLRAQIFVYGSLIQGIAPDEACMISAFGETDGGRSLWEGVWRISAERYQHQKSPFSSCEIPSHSRSGSRVPEQVTKCSSIQSKAPSTPASQSGNKVLSSAISNSAVPLPSLLCSISTSDGLHSNTPRVTYLDFDQALSPFPSHQYSQIRQYTGNSATWLSQRPRTRPWGVSSKSSAFDTTVQYSALPVSETVRCSLDMQLVSPTALLPTPSQSSAFDATAQFSALLVAEAVQVTPVRDSSIPHTLNRQLMSPSALLPTLGPTSIPAASNLQVETEKKITAGNSRSASSAQKSRTKKNGPVREELQPNILVSEPFAEPNSVAGVTMHSPPMSAGFPTSGNSPTKVASTGLISAMSHIISPAHYQIIGCGDPEQRTIFSEKTCSKIEHAKLQAEDAAAFAASVVKHSQGIWSQLATQKKSELITYVDEKLASAAVAASAAAAVAKAAAAAAKVASDAALQAKMMADEALNSVKPGNLIQISESGLLDVGKSLAKLTPVSILNGKDKVHGSSSIIFAAREAARRRVEAASAATKRAENLDAIVKAAELAAEAVSQAGTIIAMGEPLPFTLSELVEAGPESHWKVHHSTTDKLAKTNSLRQEEIMALSVEQFNKQLSNSREKQKTTDEEGILCFNGHSMQLKEHYKGNESGHVASTVPIDRHANDNSTSNNEENIIQKGSLVEVVSDEDGLRRVWFSARVLDVNDGKAYICYTDLLPDEGAGQLQEWISLEGEGNKAPKIRLAHPMTATKYEGTRKRRREAIGSYVWAVGDRVDAWIRDGWWEGIVTEKSQGDDTKLTVHFPAGGDSSIARAWNLRPSLVWEDGQWIEWSRAREHALQLCEGDTPQEKRQKLGRLEARIDPEVDGKGTGKLSKNLPFEDSRKLEESRPLILSAKDRTFSVGKNAREEGNSDALKVRRTGLQKEGSRVVFGVPKPGKKRKFMEVSKHYVADKTDKTSEGNDSIKLEKYLMPQASRVWRNSSKVDLKRKIASDWKPKGLKSVKSQCIQTRNIADKDNSSVTSTSTGGETGHGSLPNVRAAFSNVQYNLEKKSLLEVDSFANSLGIIENPHEERSVQPVPGPSSKKNSSSAVEAVGVKGKLTRAVNKSTRSEEKGSENTGKTISDAPEPRRSIRRIQPTSRLLEGLQSSLIASKIPNFPQDKSNKSHHRAASSRGNSHG